MLHKSISFFQKKADNMGVPIHIPQPSKKAKKISAITNGAAGIGLGIAGIAISSKLLIGLGTLGLISATYLSLSEKKESKNIE